MPGIRKVEQGSLGAGERERFRCHIAASYLLSAVCSWLYPALPLGTYMPLRADIDMAHSTYIVSAQFALQNELHFYLGAIDPLCITLRG